MRLREVGGLKGVPVYWQASSQGERFLHSYRLLACALATLLCPGLSAAEIYDLGGMYTYHYRDGRYADWGDYALHGARIAIDVANQSGLLGDDQIRLKPENTIDYHCWPDNAAVMAETLMQKDILALTGADCSGPAVEMARIAGQYGVPVISNGANASALSSTKEFPWFVRVVTPSEQYEGYLIDVAANFGVRRIAYFHTNDAWGLGARRVIREYAAKNAVAIVQEFGFDRDTPMEQIVPALTRAKDAGLRHIVMTGPTPDTVTVFRGLHKLDMNQPGYSIYAAEMISADEGAEPVAGSVGYFAPMTMLPESPELSKFQELLEARLGTQVDPDSKAFFYGALSYDHILAVTHAIRAAKEAGDAVNRANLMRHLRAIDFAGATGRVSIVPGTNDRGHMAVQIFNGQGYKADGKTVHFVPVGYVDPDDERLVMHADRILWPGNVRRPPAPE